MRSIISEPGGRRWLREARQDDREPVWLVRGGTKLVVYLTVGVG